MRIPKCYYLGKQKYTNREYKWIFLFAATKKKKVRKERKKRMVNLSDGEWKIMNKLWEKESTITELTAALQEETGWDKHIIITMLNRMEKKTAIAHKEGGRAKIFYPLVSREEVSVQEAKGFLQKVFRGSIGMMVNTMVKDEALTEAEVKELYEILEQAYKK